MSLYPAKDTLPKPIGTIDELLVEGDSTVTPHKVFIGHNLGRRSFLMSVPLYRFFTMSEVANERKNDGEDDVAQRKLDPAHATKLAVYMLRGLISAVVHARKVQEKLPLPTLDKALEELGRQPYMALQPIVVNIRTCQPEGRGIAGSRMNTADGETACFKVMLGQKDILWVVDGQHRRKGMEMLFEFLDQIRMQHALPKKGLYVPADGHMDLSNEEMAAWNEVFEHARSLCSVLVEVHLGLSIDEERQLFHDLNNLGKKVETSLALKFDNSNPVNQFIKEELVSESGILANWKMVEKDIAVGNWQNDQGEIPRKDLVVINALLFLNKSNISGAKPILVEAKKDVAIKFWDQVSEIPGLGSPGARMETVAAQPVVLKALAKLVYDFAFGRHQDSASLNNLLDGIPTINFAHTNPIWRFYTMTPEQRTAAGLDSLKPYLPSDDQGKNRDIGMYDEKAQLMRFGAKHNDIYPIIGDMIRWMLKLPNRHAADAAKAA